MNEKPSLFTLSQDLEASANDLRGMSRSAIPSVILIKECAEMLYSMGVWLKNFDIQNTKERDDLKQQLANLKVGMDVLESHIQAVEEERDELKAKLAEAEKTVADVNKAVHAANLPHLTEGLEQLLGEAFNTIEVSEDGPYCSTCSRDITDEGNGHKDDCLANNLMAFGWQIQRLKNGLDDLKKQLKI